MQTHTCTHSHSASYYPSLLLRAHRSHGHEWATLPQPPRLPHLPPRGPWMPWTFSLVPQAGASSHLSPAERQAQPSWQLHGQQHPRKVAEDEGGTPEPDVQGPQLTSTPPGQACHQQTWGDLASTRCVPPLWQVLSTFPGCLFEPRGTDGAGRTQPAQAGQGACCSKGRARALAQGCRRAQGLGSREGPAALWGMLSRGTPRALRATPMPGIHCGCSANAGSPEPARQRS